MTFATLQTFQAALEASVRELAAKQLSLVQTFAEKQKEVFTNPAALLAPKNFTDNQVLVQEFVTANQAFIASSLLATQTYWRDQLAENQAALQAAGIPGVNEAVEHVQAAVKKATAPLKTTRAKR